MEDEKSPQKCYAVGKAQEDRPARPSKDNGQMTLDTCRKICIEHGMADNRARIAAWALLCESGAKRTEAVGSFVGRPGGLSDHDCGAVHREADVSGSNSSSGCMGESCSEHIGDVQRGPCSGRGMGEPMTAPSEASAPSPGYGAGTAVLKTKCRDVSQGEQDTGGVVDNGEETRGSSGRPVNLSSGTRPISDDWGADLPKNCQARVIVADVRRSLWKLYPDDALREEKRRCLCNILAQILCTNPERHYYQGLHEMVGFVMYVMEGAQESTIVGVCEKLLLCQWHSFSSKQFECSQSMMYAVHAIVAKEEKDLAEALEVCGVGPDSHYAMSWLITWYTHGCEDVEALGRLFDFLIASVDENTIIFFTAALMTLEKRRIMNIINSVKGSCCNWSDDGGEVAAMERSVVMVQVHSALVMLPNELLRHDRAKDIEDVIRQAIVLQGKYFSYVKHVRSRFLQDIVPKSKETRYEKGKQPSWLWSRFSLFNAERRWAGVGLVCVIAVLAMYYRERTLRGASQVGEWLDILYTMTRSVRSFLGVT